MRSNLPSVGLSDPAEWAAHPDDVLAVLRSVLCEFWPDSPDAAAGSIVVYCRDDFPLCHTLRDQGGRVRIGLSAGGRLWAKYSYQFAHECCHALAMHSVAARVSGAHFGEAGWFEETLCETASLFTLLRMADAWETRPPFANWADYATALRGYVYDLLAQPEHARPAGSTFCGWFEANQHVFRETAVDRPRNTIVARELLPVFQAEPAGWAAVAYLQDEGFRAWRAACPEPLRPFVDRLAGVFAPG